MKSQPKSKDLYQQITDKIVASLEEGVLPWQKPWSVKALPVPCNGESGRHYSGINLLLLWLSSIERNFTQRKWVTFQGANHLGGQVRAGEKSTLIIFYKQNLIEEKDDSGAVVLDENGEAKMKTSVLIRGHHVFNIEQCEGLEAHYEVFEETQSSNEARPELDVLPAKMGLPLYNRVQNKACYIPSKDSILMPTMTQFESIQGYYAILLHECGHATGHKSRLKRDAIVNGVKFGSPKYAFEELIAELTSAFTCAEFGICNISQNAAYLDSWIKTLKADKKAIFKASSKAREATDYIMQAFNQADVKLAA